MNASGTFSEMVKKEIKKRRSLKLLGKQFLVNVTNNHNYIQPLNYKIKIDFGWWYVWY